MNYERNIEHCEPSPYIKFVTIAKKKDAVNSDNLEIIHFHEMAWRTVVTKGKYSIGDKVFFIPVDSVLPNELVDLLGISKYLSRGRVKITSLRGNPSEGLIADPDVVGPYLPYIMKWEDLPTLDMCGQIMSPFNVNPMFHVFYKMPNIMFDTNVFNIGEEIYYSEKIHGTNGRAAVMFHPNEHHPYFYIGGHYQVFKPVEENSNVLYVNMAKKHFGTNGERLLPNHIFYFEIYGRKVQNLDYGINTPELRVFAIKKDFTYLAANEVSKICNNLNIPCVKFHLSIYTNIDDYMEIANSPSELYNGLREGIVLVSKNDPNKMGKIIGQNYLKKQNRTERH